MATIDETLGQFKEDDLTIKLIKTLNGVIPFAPEFVFYNSLEGAVTRLGGTAEHLAKAQQLAADEATTGKALWMSSILDTSDKLIAGYAGVKNLLSFFSSEKKERTFESDPQQALDAALKGAGLSYMSYKILPGTATEKVGHLKDLPAGQEALIYFAVGEVALPFTDNLAEGGANLVQRLMSSQESELASKFGSFAGQEQFTQAKEMLDHMVTPLGGYVEQAKSYTNPFVDKIKGFLPSAATVANVADSATGVAATGVDLMPVWTFLGARLAAEACALKAIRGL